MHLPLSKLEGYVHSKVLADPIQINIQLQGLYFENTNSGL